MLFLSIRVMVGPAGKTGNDFSLAHDAVSMDCWWLEAIMGNMKVKYLHVEFSTVVQNLLQNYYELFIPKIGPKL